MDKRKKVIGVIRDMNVGDVEVFPIIQSDSIRTTVYNRLMADRLQGKRWSVRINAENLTVEVKRLS